MATEFYSPLLTGQGAFQRKWGTSPNKIVEPYVTGYHFANFSYVPSQISNVMATMFPSSDLVPSKSIANILSSTVLAVNVPGININRTTVEGLGGIKFTLPTSTEFENTFSVKFLEVSGTPIFKIISSWARLVRDTIYGISLSNNKSSYSGSMFYWTTRPDGITVEFACCLSGIYPTKIPTDSFSHDLANIDKLEIEVEFAVDYIFLEKWVYDACKGLAASYRGKA